MERLQLTEDLLTGWDDIDDQHEQLFELANAFIDVDEGDEDGWLETIAFVSGFVTYHFAAEEKAMRHHEYGELDAHAATHTELRQEIEDLRAELFAKGPVRGVKAKLRSILGESFGSHVKGWDRRLAAFLRGDETGTAEVEAVPPERDDDNVQVDAVPTERDADTVEMEIVLPPARGGDTLDFGTPPVSE